MVIMTGKNHKNVGIWVPIRIQILIVGLIELIYNPWWWHLIILISTYAIITSTGTNIPKPQNDWKTHGGSDIMCVSQSKTSNI